LLTNQFSFGYILCPQIATCRTIFTIYVYRIIYIFKSRFRVFCWSDPKWTRHFSTSMSEIHKRTIFYHILLLLMISVSNFRVFLHFFVKCNFIILLKLRLALISVYRLFIWITVGFGLIYGLFSSIAPLTILKQK